MLVLLFPLMQGSLFRFSAVSLLLQILRLTEWRDPAITYMSCCDDSAGCWNHSWQLCAALSWRVTSTCSWNFLSLWMSVSTMESCPIGWSPDVRWSLLGANAQYWKMTSIPLQKRWRRRADDSLCKNLHMASLRHHSVPVLQCNRDNYHMRDLVYRGIFTWWFSVNNSDRYIVYSQIKILVVLLSTGEVFHLGGPMSWEESSSVDTQGCILSQWLGTWSFFPCPAAIHLRITVSLSLPFREICLKFYFCHSCGTHEAEEGGLWCNAWGIP